MTIKHLYPTSRPSLDLNFARDKKLDPRITFSRSSSGTYVDAFGVLQSAATNIARFDHNPSTGESLGLLVEEARTNSWTYSDRFDDASWTKTNVVATPNTLLAPDGNFIAQLLISQAAGTATVNRTFTRNNPAFSIFIKAGSSSTANVKIQSDVVGRNVSYNVNLSTGVLTAGTGNTGNLTGWTEYISITSVGNGWYRIFIGFSSSTITVNSTYSISPSSNGSATAANESVYIWGAQLETGSFPTSYIPTPATFTGRTSTATYYDANGVIQTALSGVARSNAYFPDSNGVMRSAGLLLEAAETNYIGNSSFSSITNVSVPTNPVVNTWTVNTVSNVTATSSAVVAPDGSNSVKLVNVNGYTGNANTSSAHETCAISATGLVNVQTYSVYAKAGELSVLGLRIGNAGTTRGSAAFDLQNKQAKIVSGSFSLQRAEMQPVGNGWFRCIVYGSSPSSAPTFGIIPLNDYANATFSGDGTSGLYVWGAQLEASPYPTSYIPTTGSTVTRSADTSTSATATRSADVAQMTGANFSSWWNTSSGTFQSSFRSVLSGTRPVLSVDDNTVNNRIELYTSTANQKFTVTAGGVTQADLTAGSASSASVNKQAAVYSANDFSTSLAGATAVTDTSGTVPVVTQMRIGANQAGNTRTSPIASISYYPVRLPNATLQTLTK